MKRTLLIISVLMLLMIAVVVQVSATTEEFRFEDGVWHYYVDDEMRIETYAINNGDNDKLYYFDAKGKGSIYTGYYDKKYYEKGNAVKEDKIVVDSKGQAYKCDKKGNAELYTGIYNEKYYNNGVKVKNKIVVTDTGKAYKCNNEGKANPYTGVYNGVFYWKNGKPANVKSRKRLVKFYDKYYYVNKKGKVYKPKHSGAYVMDNGKRYYIYYTGKVKKVNKAGIYKANGEPYYFYKGSNIRYTKKGHWWNRNGKLYRVASNGRIVTGFFEIGKNKYYARKNTCNVLKGGIFTVNGYKYWFDEKGRIYTSKWRMKNKGKYQYFNRNGVMLRNQSAYIGKYKFFFNKNGVVQKDLFKYKGLKWVKKQQIRIAVNRNRNVITFYAKDGDKGYTIPLYACLCSVGTADHPTPLGTSYTSPKRTHRWMRLGGPHINTALCWGQYVVHYNGRRYFHSCCYNTKNIRNLVTYNYNYLGRAASHGCIRMRAVDAQRLYTLAKYKSLQVKVYSSSVAGPFGKPIYKKIPAGQNYDPSDPNL